METVTLDMIHRDLEFVKRELMEIKERMVDTDRIITEDDYKALHEYGIEKSGTVQKSSDSRTLYRILTLFSPCCRW